jgi:acetyl-CoA acyltransferase
VIDEREEFLPETDAVRAELGERADSVWVREAPSVPQTARVVCSDATGTGGRVAIVDGCRTPFCKAGTDLAAMDVVDLSGVVTAELVARSGIEPESIDLSVFGVVVAALHAPNLGREAIFRASLPAGIPGTSVNLACASSNRAITSGAEAILSGQCEVVLAGGAESLSNVPFQYSQAASRQLIAFSKARSAGQRLAALTRLRPRDLVPVPPAIAEYSTGMTMGQAAEKMAKENEISRLAQDEIALLSHQRAAVAIGRGDFERQIVATFPPPEYDHPVLQDNGVRGDSSLEALAKLRPVFDKRYGSVTAGNSSPITDGAAVVLLMSEERAARDGHEPLGFIRSWAYASVDPGGQLLQGPAYAAPAALDGAGLRLDEIDLVEMHEAFAAQVLSNLKAFASPRFARRELGREEPLGEIDLQRFNVHGGSIAVGHPFGATGARVTLQLLDELTRRNLRHGLVTVCAAGGVGFAMVVESR